MPKTIKSLSSPFFATLILVAAVTAQIVPGSEVYLTDSKLARGKVYQVIKSSPSDPSPFPNSVYSSKVGGISSIAIGRDGWLYYVDANRFNIERTDGRHSMLVFRHTTYVRDLAFDSAGHLFFSEATGAARDGTIYKLDTTTHTATVYRRIRLDQVDGFWAGQFAFDPSDTLHLSTGNRTRAGLYAEIGGQLKLRFTFNEPITGFAFISPTSIVFTNHGTRLYRLDNLVTVSTLFESTTFGWMNDVLVVPEPRGAECSISGRLIGGSSHWGITWISAYGPNLFWRERGGQKVGGNGTYSISGLPAGTYWVIADVHADVGGGFRPLIAGVRCEGAVTGVDFRWR